MRLKKQQWFCGGRNRIVKAGTMLWRMDDDVNIGTHVKEAGKMMLI